mmetsp:Transcript_52855/g.123687  ORF Transcript_52855/g.123687 Transcript_52855/m.123687 type:complete len:282 (+) Transcript_52855:48-893(+)
MHRGTLESADPVRCKLWWHCGQVSILICGWIILHIIARQQRGASMCSRCTGCGCCCCKPVGSDLITSVCHSSSAQRHCLQRLKCKGLCRRDHLCTPPLPAQHSPCHDGQELARPRALLPELNSVCWTAVSANGQLKLRLHVHQGPSHLCFTSAGADEYDVVLAIKSQMDAHGEVIKHIGTIGDKRASATCLNAASGPKLSPDELQHFCQAIVDRNCLAEVEEGLVKEGLITIRKLRQILQRSYDGSCTAVQLVFASCSGFPSHLPAVNHGSTDSQDICIAC